MVLFIKRYLSALAVLLMAMAGYRLVLVPAIEPPPRPPAPLPNFSGALGGPQWWQALFPAGAWQVDEPQIIQSKRGVVLLSRNYIQTGPRTLSLKPLTIVLPQTRRQSVDNGPQEVLIISAEQGAEIHFEQDFDPSGMIPSVERGELRGLIEVSRQVHGGPNDYPWSIRTSHLSLNRGQVSTPQAVTIQWPDGIVQGHDMKLTLQGDLLANVQRGSSSPWGPLRTLELYHLDRLEMTLPAGGLWRQARVPPPPGQPDTSQLPAQVKAVCGGRFTFDFTQSRATLVNGVHFLHQLGDLPADEFQSQEVTVELEPPTTGTPAATATAQGSPRLASSALGGMQIKWFEATGVDSLENFVGERRVELNAPNIGAFAMAKRIRVDLTQNRIELDGKLNRPGATQSTAWLKYLGHEFTAPRIDYDRDGLAGSGGPPPGLVEHLGYLIASGAGELRMPAESPAGATLVRWQESLEMRPTETDGQQWIGLFGGVLIESSLHGYLASDELELWLKKNDAATTANETRAAVAAGSGAGQFVPERLHAVGQVTLNNQQIQAEIDQLSLALHFIPTRPPTGASDQGLALSDSSGRPMYQWLGPPSAAAAPGPIAPVPVDLPTASMAATSPAPPAVASLGSHTAAAETAGVNPVTVTGRELTSSVIVAGNESWIDNLTVSGPLHVTAAAAGENRPGWQVDGDQLQMATNPSGQVDLQITGRPAKISVADGALEGPTIRFDQRSNLIWMDQPGEFTLPVTSLAQRPGSAPLRWFKPPHCSWQGRMMFDGQAVRIEGDIRFDGAVAVDQSLWYINGQSEVLQLELSQAVNLNDIKSATAQPHQLTISQNVNILASQLDSLGNKRSRQQLQLPTLTFDLQSNELLGIGPGSVRSWHITSAFASRVAASAGGEVAASNRSGPPEQLQGAHLIFRDSMRGFLDHSEIYFQGKVELAAGPLASWDDAIDVTRLQHLALDQMHLDCDLLKVYDTSSLSTTGPAASPSRGSAGGATKTWEFQAKGNVHFAGKAESGDYEGSGSEVNYVQAKELLTLLGEPRRAAHVIIRPSGPSQASLINASVEYAAINPHIPSLESYKMGAQGIDVQLQGSQSQGTGQPSGQPTPPRGDIPNPRGTVTDFLRRP